MVGVPGKFKGCNTCRTRRVKCDNQRPDCQKCIDSGRPCGGYTRETIFIVGTVTDQGRCSSHPHRAQTVGKPKSTPPAEKIGIPRPVQVQHEFGSTLASIADAPSDQIPCMALHANFSVLVPTHERRDELFSLPTLNHKLPGPISLSHDGEFSLRAACFLHSGPTKADNTRFGSSGCSRPSSSGGTMAMDVQADPGVDKGERPLLLFVFEQTASKVVDFGTFKNVMGGTSNAIKERGSSSFQKFPDHYFFARIYRPAAICHAMLQRKTTFLADPQWWTTPWEDIPKNDMDFLLDIQVLLPGIFERVARLEAFPASGPRKLKAKDLLSNCEKIDKMFGEWYIDLCDRFEDSLFWPCQPTAQSLWRGNRDWKPRDSLRSFSDVEFEFADVQIALIHINYWAGLCLLYQTMSTLHLICAEQIPSPSPPQLTRYSGVPNASYPLHTSASFAPQPFPGATPQQLMPTQIETFVQGAFPYAPTPQTYTPDQPFFRPMPQSFSQTAPQIFTTMSQPYFQPESSFFYNGTQSVPQPPAAPYHDANYQQTFLHESPSSTHLSVHSTSQTATPTPPSIGSFSTDSNFSDSAILTLAQNICRAVPYSFRNILENHGPDHISWPLLNAQQVYRRHGPEFEMEALWCGHVVEILKEEGRLLSSQMTSKNWKEFQAVNI